MTLMNCAWHRPFEEKELHLVLELTNQDHTFIEAQEEIAIVIFDAPSGSVGALHAHSVLSPEKCANIASQRYPATSLNRRFTPSTVTRKHTLTFFGGRRRRGRRHLPE